MTKVELLGTQQRVVAESRHNLIYGLNDKLGFVEASLVAMLVSIP